MLIHYPPQLSKHQETVVKKLINDWSIANGLVLKTPDGKGSTHAPVTVFPSPFSKSGYEQALRIQTAFNELYQSVSQRPEWVLSVLDSLAIHDDFTRRLIHTHRAVPQSKRTQRLSAGVFRSDYMVNKLRTDDVGRQIKQVEFNTIAVSFGGLSTRVSELHRYLAGTSKGGIFHGDVPRSPSLEYLSNGLASIHSAYVYAETSGAVLSSQQDDYIGKLVSGTENAVLTDEDEDLATPSRSTFVTPDPPTPRAASPSETGERPASQAVAILTIVQPGETNVVDQRLIEFDLYNKHDIVSYRLTLSEIKEKCTVTEKNRLIFLPTGNEISVVYYRAGYSPDDYPTEKEWEARLMLEGSHAIQIPSVITQLAGAKKIQQVLTDKNTLTRIAPQFESEAVSRLLNTFVKIYPLDDSPKGVEGRKLAMEFPERYVLKPQREGGGNNIYREDIPAFLESIPKDSWGAYVLMELIEPPRISNRILRNGELVSGRVVSELGVFGTILWDKETGYVLHNEQSGWLLRTKLQSSDEGGIAAGFGCLDSVLLNAR